MNFSNVDILLNTDTIVLFNGYRGEMCFQIGDAYFPDKNAVANPADILRRLLKELRLCLSEKTGREEKHIYFSTENREYIFLEYMGDNVLKMRFLKEAEKKSARSGVVMTALSFVSSEKKKEIETEKIEVLCEYDTLFIKVYDTAQKVFLRLCEDVLQGGETVPLEQELKYAKSIYNKIKRTSALEIESCN